MRFFTPQACNRFSQMDSTDLFVGKCRDYSAHLLSLADRLPERILELAQPRGLENGLLFAYQHDHEAKTLEMRLRCGDLIMGYFDLCLCYSGVSLAERELAAIAHIVETTKTSADFKHDFMYQEFDLDEEGRVVHSMIFHGKGSIWPSRLGWVVLSFTCDDIQWDEFPQPSREILSPLNQGHS